MKRREAKLPASDEQLDLPFDRRPKATRTNGAEPLAVRIPDAVRMTGIGRSKLYELIASGELETIKIGRCTLVTIDALKELLARARAASHR
jgi:excisionase family DNA binding protein